MFAERIDVCVQGEFVNDLLKYELAFHDFRISRNEFLVDVCEQSTLL